MRPSFAHGGQQELHITAHVPERFVAGTLANVVLFYWTGDGTIESVQVLERLIEQQTAGFTRKASAMHLIHQRVSLPDAQVRAGLVAAMKRAADFTGCIAIVMLGGGFWASAIQSALTGMRMLAPTGSSTMRFGSNPAALSDWFVTEHAERTGERISEQQLLTAAEQLRSAGDAAYPR
jgi:hypothetical protein